MNEYKFKLRFWTYFGEFDVKSPSEASAFLGELRESIRRNSGNPEWDGFFEFENTDGKTFILNLMEIKAVADLGKLRKTKQSS